MAVMQAAATSVAYVTAIAHTIAPTVRKQMHQTQHLLSSGDNT